MVYFCHISPNILSFWNLFSTLYSYLMICNLKKYTTRIIRNENILLWGISKNFLTIDYIDDKEYVMCVCWHIGIFPGFIQLKSDIHEVFDNSEMVKKPMISIIVQKLIRGIHFLHVFLWNPSNFIHFSTILKTYIPNSCI